MMKLFWKITGLGFLVSFIYFVAYLLSNTLQLAVNQSHALSIFHGCMSVLMILAVFSLITRIIYVIFYRH